MMEKVDMDALFEKVKGGSARNLNEYDVTVLMKLSNRLKKWKKAEEWQGRDKIKIAVLGSYSIQHFVGVLDVFLQGQGIHTEIYEGEYDGINMDVLDENSGLYRFAPEIVILMTHTADIRHYPALLSSEEEVEEVLKKQMAYYRHLWECIGRIPGCQVMQTNFVVPLHRALGNMEADYLFSAASYIRLLNLELAKQRPKYVTIMDMDYIASLVGKKKWFDYSSYFLTKAGFHVEFLGEAAKLFSTQIASLKGKTRKCLVLDLDNTLWGGVVGDDGYDGIQIDPHHAVGEAYRYFQQYVKKLRERGVILAVCSKNDEDVAKQPFLKNPDMILKLSDFACFRANWEDKAGNIRAIAKELNIGLDSLVFVDDNPAEREIVRQYVPEVLVIDLPEDPAEYADALEEASPFEWMELTKEDLCRAESYSANKEREELFENFVNYEEYLQALLMEGNIGIVGDAQMERFVQLINKSNQFNLRTKRYTDAQIEELRHKDDVRLLYVDLKDRFTSYGIISCIILKKVGEDCFIDTWLMSCRVLKRGVEDFAFLRVIEEAERMGCTRIIGEYIPSKKNGMVKEFYKELGFSPLEEPGWQEVPESTLFMYPVTEKYQKRIYINSCAMED